MKDYSKSAIRCLKLCCEAGNLDQKLFYLTKAEQHLLEELKQANETFFPLQEGSVSQKHERVGFINRLIGLQRELIVNYPDKGNLSFFGGKDTQGELCQELLMIEGADLGLRLIEVYRLKVEEELGRLLERLAKEKDLISLEKVLQNMVFWKKKGFLKQKNIGKEVYKRAYFLYNPGFLDRQKAFKGD